MPDPRFQAFCEEGDCPWSSPSSSLRDSVLGAIEHHLEYKHGRTLKTGKYEIDEGEYPD